MPGIVGLFALDGRTVDTATVAVLDRMGAAIAHRGLARRRVLSRGPFAAVVVEGSPEQDLPILVFADGLEPAHAVDTYARQPERLVPNLPGHFALALWDQARGRLVLARDALGMCPLFHARVETAHGPLLLFASELKALLCHPDCPRELDWTTALAHQAMPRRRFAPTSYFRGIENLPPGTCLTAERDGITLTRYDVLEAIDPDAIAADRRSAPEVIAQFRDVFVAAVEDSLGAHRDHSGIMLSGGIDSLAIAAVAARSARPCTFTVLSQSTWGNGDARGAHDAAALLDLPEHPILFRWDEPMSPESWRRLLWLCETPLAGPQHYYKFHLHRQAAAVRPDLAIMLNGEGSDELMGADFRNHGEDRPDGTFEDYLADLEERQRIDLHSVETLAVERWFGRPAQSRAALARASNRELADYAWQRRLSYVLPALAQDVLWRDDRLAAGHHLLAGAPYLDRRLVEFVLHMPRHQHARLFWHKHMLREAMRGIVPESLRASPKIGFFAGVDAHYTARLLHAMLMSDDYALVREALNDGDHPELAPGLVTSLIADCQADPQRLAASALLTLVNLGLLDKMARADIARPGSVFGVAPLTALDAWDAQAIEQTLRGDRPCIGPDAVLALAPGVELVRKDEATMTTPTWYVLIDDQARYVLDEDDTRPWCEVLRRIDGRRTLGAVLAECGVELADISKHLDQALELAVVVMVATARHPVTSDVAAA